MLTPDRIQITRHAADKYRARNDDSLSVDDAFKLLTTNASSAAPLKTKTPAGDEQWRLETPRPCILVIRRDNNHRSIAVIVTVLKVPDVIVDDCIGPDEQRLVMAVLGQHLGQSALDQAKVTARVG